MIPLKKWIEAFLKDLDERQGSSENTRQAYRSDLMQYSNYLQTKESVSAWNQVTDLQIAKFIYALKDKQEAPATLARKSVSIRRFHRYLVRNHLLERDPSVMIDMPRISPKSPLILTVSEVASLLAAPLHSEPPKWRDAAVLELLYATGMRVTELTGLNRSDLNLELGYIRCRSVQGRERVVPFGEPAKEVLGRYLENSENRESSAGVGQPLFQNRSNARMTRQSIWKMMKLYADKAGLKPGLSPETLRNSLTAHLFERGADPESVDELMGRSVSAGGRRFPQRQKETLREMYGRCHPRAKIRHL